MNQLLTPEELASEIGGNIRALRLLKNIPQKSLAAHAGVSLTALRHLESAQGANLMTFIRVVRALDKEEWLRSLAPRVTINPLHMVRGRDSRLRARQKKKAKPAQL
ncbi:MAG: helix-turn-helix domain-containing protein [Elusimicrobia bacterium]|nr:helix-turn-helix domain-containing protein [Elusimicrobiota bacterium]